MEEEVQDVSPVHVMYLPGPRGVDVVLDAVAQDIRHVIDTKYEENRVEDHAHTRLVSHLHVIGITVNTMENQSQVDAGAGPAGQEPAVAQVSKRE